MSWLWDESCARMWDDPEELLAHVQKEHPEQIDPGMPSCVHCGMPCNAGRKPLAGWRCNYCRQWQDEARCPVCGQRTTRDQIRWDRVAGEPVAKK